MDLENFVEQLKNGGFRRMRPNDNLQQVCFSAELAKFRGEIGVKADNQLVKLELNNLRDLTTAEEYRRLAATVPYTMLSFVGSDGHSIIIVCRYQLAEGKQIEGQPEVALMNAYRKLLFVYSSQLGTRLEVREPKMSSTCDASYDPKAFFRPDALPIVVNSEPEETPEFRQQQEDISDYNNPEEIPGLSLRTSRTRRFHDCLDAAIASCEEVEKDMFVNAVLEKLAAGCHEMGLPAPWCVRMATFVPMLGGDRELIGTIFRTTYLKDIKKTIPLKFVSPSALLAYKTEAYMKEHYTLRMNVMTGVPEYRQNALGYGFLPLDQKARNTMTINALKAGVDSWDKDLNRYIDSDLIPRYEPMDDYLTHLPKWDGRDRVEELAQRVKTDDPNWPRYFHTWMLSMVAQWEGKSRLLGNAIVPLLIGPQGSGKTTFCSRLLPAYLLTYFNDRLPMKNDTDLMMALSSYALINLDEFDAMSKSQQPVLKYLLSKHDVKLRPPYGKVIEERQRFASFIATTNNRRPLIDPTGSRRFVCVYSEAIDNSGSINHDQLYAQLMQELKEGRRYWLDDEETRQLMEHNQRFQRVEDYEQMISLTYLSPDETPEDVKPTSVKAVMQTLSQHFPTFIIHKDTDMAIGRKLKTMGYLPKKTSRGMAYLLALR